MDQITLSRKELYDLVWSEPMLSISRKFRISDRGLGKMCNRMKIPTPYPGYWRQVERRKNPPKTRLGRGRAGGQTTITLVRRGVEEGPVSPFVILRRQIELEHHSDLSVPRRFGRLHPLIANAKEGLNNGPPENKSSVNIDVSPINKRYALRLLNAIILLFIKRGHHVEGNCFIIGGTRWLFSLTERLETPVDGSSPQRHKPTNVFKFKVEGYSKFVFNDTKRERLEKKLSKKIFLRGFNEVNLFLNMVSWIL